MSENTELTTATEGGTALSIFTNTDSFELAQRAGKMLASSDLVPKQFQNNIPNCVIALNIASRLGADPFAVLQSLYIVHGRPAWSSQFLIAMVNASGRYSPLQFRMTGQGDSAACVAWARHLETDEVVEGPEVSIKMAKAEGWYNKAGSKWQTLPKLMLMYRSAGFFARLYCPDLCLGMRTMEEESDIGKTAKEPPVFTASPTQTVTKVDGEDTVVIDAEETTKDEPDPRADALAKVLDLVTNSDATPDQIDTVLRGRGVLGETGTIPRLGEAKLKDIADEFASIEAEALASSDPVML
tara:strand:- start:1108 stop:2001 length:894 start_codon:yes stop_codon:yes gene_type:complete